MRTLIIKLPHTEVKFYPEVKSQTGLSLLRISCKRALSLKPPDSFDKRTHKVSRVSSKFQFVILEKVSHLRKKL